MKRRRAKKTDLGGRSQTVGQERRPLVILVILVVLDILTRIVLTMSNVGT